MTRPRWLLLLCTLLLAAPIQAEESWYEIELIAFARNDPGSGQTEGWPLDPGVPDASNTHSIQSDLSPSPFVLLPETAYKLSGSARQLERTGGRLEPLLHLAWRQPVHDRERAEGIYVQSPSHVAGPAEYLLPPRLEGSIKVSLSRYLHIDLDLLLRDEAAMQQPSGYGMATNTYRSYRMQDHRRMRSDELHYIDHPLMGVLVEIRPYEEPQSEAVPEAPIPLPKTAAPTATPMAEPAAAAATTPTPAPAQ